MSLFIDSSSHDSGVATCETAAVGHRVSCPDFVGRAEELDLLDATLDRVIDGHAATVLVGGDAGIGKTRLVDEFCERARARDALVAKGVCVPIDGGGLPYGPVVGILRDLVRQLGETTATDVLGPLASGLGVPGLGKSAELYSAGPRMLFISKKTVSVHVSNVLRKLDVANRIEAGRVGQAQGLGVS